MSAALGRGEADAPRMGVARRAMVRRMIEAGDVPVFYLRRSADITDLLVLRKQPRETNDQPIASINDYIVKAVGLALREHLNVNSSWEDDSVLLHSRVNVGVAIAIEGGLVVPAIYDADVSSVEEIAANVRVAADLAAARKLSREMLADSTFTLSNLGMFGIEDFDPLINRPQAAILGIGAGAKGSDGRTRIRMTMGCDHRVLTGAEAAPFLATVCELLGEPARLVSSNSTTKDAAK